MAEKKTARHDTWMPLYVGEYLADTMELNAEQHGAYLLMLMHAWKSDGKLPADPARLCQIARMSPQQWSRSEPLLREFFNCGPDAWTHKRVVNELGKAKDFVEKKSAAGKLGAKKKWGIE